MLKKVQWFSKLDIILADIGNNLKYLSKLIEY